MLQSGGCLCGQVRYAVNAAPVRVTICHCRFCQRATGSAYMVEPIFDKAALSLTAGAPKIYSQPSAGSGKQVNVHFCDRCGTKLFLSFERWPDFVGAYAGTFDDPNWFDRSATNTRHIFLNFAQKGTAIAPGLPTYDEHVATLDGTPIAPSIRDTARIIDAAE